MGLLFGLGLLAAAAVPDACRSIKAKAYSDWETKTYGPHNVKAACVIKDIIGGTHICQQMYGFTVKWDGKKLRELNAKYEAEGEPKAWYHAIHDIAKEFCEKNGIPFTGKYVHTFYLPGHSIWC